MHQKIWSYIAASLLTVALNASGVMRMGFIRTGTPHSKLAQVNHKNRYDSWQAFLIHHHNRNRLATVPVVRSSLVNNAYSKGARRVQRNACDRQGSE